MRRVRFVLLAVAAASALASPRPARGEDATLERAPVPWGRGITPVEGPVAVAAEARAALGGERERARRGTWLWAIAGTSSAAYLASGWGGYHAPHAVLTPLAVVGFLAAAVGVGQGAVRQAQLSGLEARLAAEGAPGPATVRAVGAELRSIQASARSVAGGGARAGCVVPLLLSGIGLYGLALGGTTGDALAGVMLGGALAAGVPSVLTYWSLRARLERIDGLLARWNVAFATLE
jgi:hypothetical protein